MINSTVKRLLRNNLVTPKGFSMLLHEYQAQNLLRDYKVPVANGTVIKDKAEIDSALAELGEASGYAVKSQVHAGGRGLGHFKENGLKGGVHVVDTVAEVKEMADKMLGNTLVTKQTGEKGLKVNALYVVEKVGFALIRRS